MVLISAIDVCSLTTEKICLKTHFLFTHSLVVLQKRRCSLQKSKPNFIPENKVKEKKILSEFTQKQIKKIGIKLQF